MPIIQSFSANDFQFEKHYLIYLKALFVLSVLSSLVCMVLSYDSHVGLFVIISDSTTLVVNSYFFFELLPPACRSQTYILFKPVKHSSQKSRKTSSLFHDKKQTQSGGFLFVYKKVIFLFKGWITCHIARLSICKC